MVWFCEVPGPERSGQSLGHPAFWGSAIRSLPPQQAAAATPPAPLQSGLVSPRIPERSRRVHIPIKSSKNCPCNSCGESYVMAGIYLITCFRQGSLSIVLSGSLSAVEGYASLKFPKIAGTDPSAKISNFKQFQSISRKFLLKI